MVASVHIDDREFKRRLLKFSKTMPNETHEAISRSLDAVERRVKTKLSGQVLKVRTGKLRADWHKRIRRSGRGAVEGYLGSPTPYAKIHETGGEIRPKKGTALTIPTNENKTGAGVTRISARELKNQGNSFIRKGIIFEKRGGDIVPMFILARSVRIRKTRYLSSSLKESERDIHRAFQRAIGKAWTS